MIFKLAYTCMYSRVTAGQRATEMRGLVSRLPAPNPQKMGTVFSKPIQLVLPELVGTEWSEAKKRSCLKGEPNMILDL